MLQKCYEEGRQAAFDGFPLSHNRYALHTAASREWQRGWWDAGEELADERVRGCHPDSRNWDGTDRGL